ncbi:MAG: outer membrane beta-barrel protein [candidate division Zixibacteria bacterium]|nr:outer membrane beta-barrel protein [candidate division Zixibacteria bacterium]
MKAGRFGIMGTAILAVLAAVLFTGDSDAVVRRPQLIDGVYFGGVVGYQSISGDFKGNSYIRVPSLYEDNYIPEIDGGMGFGIVGGFKRGRGAFEISYVRSAHDASYQGINTDVVFQAFNFDVKYYPLPYIPTQPFLMVGLSVPWLKAENTSHNDVYGIDDAKFTGIGLNLGTGVLLKFTPHMALTGTVGYRWISYGSVKGASDEKIDISNVNGSGIMFQAGLVYTFPSHL